MSSVKAKKAPSLLEGALTPNMLRFAAPLLVTSVLLQLFNTVDTSIAGRFISDSALAAVGSTTVISGFFIEFFLGFSKAAEVIVARFLGKGEPHRATRAVGTAVLASLVCGILIALVGILTARPLLQSMHVPDAILGLATVYLRLYLASMPFFMLYHFLAAIFRADGDTRTPMLVLVGSGALKCALDFLFVLAFKLGVTGMALATVCANAFSAAVLLLLLARRNSAVRITAQALRAPDGKTVSELLRIGLPSAFLGSVFSVSNLLVQSAINSLGTAAIAATTAAVSVEIYIQFIGNAFASAATAFTAQNYGAQSEARLRQIPWIALLLCNIVTVPLSVAAFACAPWLLRVFATEGAVIALAISRMQYTLLFKPVQAVMDIMAGTLQGYGFTLVPAIASIFFVCGVRVLWIYTGFAANPSLETLMLIYPVTQGLAALSHSACFFCLQRKRKKHQKTAPHHKSF